MLPNGIKNIVYYNFDLNCINVFLPWSSIKGSLAKYNSFSVDGHIPTTADSNGLPSKLNSRSIGGHVTASTDVK